MKLLNVIFTSIVIVYSGYAFSETLADKYGREIFNTTYFKDLAISQIHTKTKTGALTYKIIVTSKGTLTDLEFAKKSYPGYRPEPYFADKEIWEITANLPLTEMQCLDVYADTCNESNNDLYKGSCFPPCIGYGPQFLSFDEKANKIYFLATSVSIGTGGGPVFLFVGDLNTKKIEYLRSDIGPYETSLSPSGKYLVMHDRNWMKIYNTITHEVFSFAAKNDWKHETEFHYLDHIKWLSDTEFTYEDAKKHTKFQDYNDYVLRNTYDILRRKIVNSHALAKNEYISTPQGGYNE